MLQGEVASARRGSMTQSVVSIAPPEKPYFSVCYRIGSLNGDMEKVLKKN